MIYIEENCTIEHEGKTFTAGGAVVTPGHIIGYAKFEKGSRVGVLTDWHGTKVLGKLVITSTWRTPRSFISGEMHQMYADVDGVRYTGRCAGSGMSFKGKAVR